MRQPGKKSDLSSTDARSASRRPLDNLYFFPDQDVAESRVRWILQHGPEEDRAWVVSHLLRFARWDDIWKFVTRAEAGKLLPKAEMPDSLRSAWARILQTDS